MGAGSGRDTQIAASVAELEAEVERLQAGFEASQEQLAKLIGQRAGMRHALEQIADFDLVAYLGPPIPKMQEIAREALGRDHIDLTVPVEQLLDADDLAVLGEENEPDV